MGSYKDMAEALDVMCSDQKKKIKTLEKELEHKDSVIRGLNLQLGAKEKIESIGENKPDYEKICKELQDQHQQDCIKINQLNVTIDILSDKYSRLRESAGMR